MKKNKKTLEASKSEKMMSSRVLSQDLMMDIFSRLPTKSLGKLRCVCKEWRSIISTPFFKSLHRHRSSLKPYLLFVEHTENCYRISIPLTTTITISSVDYDVFDFTFTSDGIACFLPLKCKTGELVCWVSAKGFYVCNPSTQELVKLAKPCFLADRGVGAFGYIQERNEYVLVNAQSAVNGNIVCRVLRWTDDGSCLNYRPWKKVRAKCPYTLSQCGAMVETSFYWIGRKDEGEDNRTKMDAVVSFDLGKEEFGTMTLPGDHFNPDDCCLVELKGMLCLTDAREDKIDIWMLTDAKNNNIWVKEYTIDLSMINYKIGRISPPDHIDGKILICVRCYSSRTYLVWYDMENKCVCEIDGPKSRQLRWCKPYTAGLFSLGSR